MDVKQILEKKNMKLCIIKEAKIVSEIKKSVAEKQRTEIVAKILEMGATPETIMTKIENLKILIEAQLNNIDETISLIAWIKL